MKKLLLILFTCYAYALFSQPMQFNYQAVVRDAAGKLIASKDVAFKVIIHQTTATGTAVATEIHTAKTNEFGLATLAIGSKGANLGSLNWGTDNFFMEVQLDPAGGSNYVSMGTTQLLSVPYAMYAQKAGNGFSGNYSDLTGKPMLATVATSGDFNDLINKPAALSNNYNDLVNKPNLATVATSGSYNDLTNKPTLFSGSYTDLTNKPVLFSGNYTDLTNKPTYAQVATTGSYIDLVNKPALFSGSYIDLTNKPVLFSGSYTDLTNKPSLATVATTGSYSDLANKPTLSTVAASGNYNDLSNKPNLSAYLTNETDPAFIASVAKGITAVDTAKWNAKSNFSGYYADLKNKPALFSGDYNDLVNKPVLFNGQYTSLTAKPANIDENKTDDVTITGNQTIAGNKTFVGTTTVATPVNPTDAATKEYVDALEIKMKALEKTLAAGGMVTDIEENYYNTVKLGTQTWMSENLRTTKYRNGDPIATTTPPALDISAEPTPKYQWAYNGDETKVSTYGRLYSWYAATDPRNVCPSGWHLPTDAEWTTLENYLISAGYNYDGTTTGDRNTNNKLAKSLASTTNWTYTTWPGVGNPDYPAKRNATGFNGHPAGTRYWAGFEALTTTCRWWSSTTSTEVSYAWDRTIYYENNQDVKRYENYKKHGLSIRCIKD